jgi:adenylate kinase
MRVVLLGPPGVGKGTQGRRLAGERGWPLISTGEILRDAVARMTPLGVQARQQMDSGNLVSDDVMIGLVRSRTLEADSANGFVLDGFPRTVPQAEALETTLVERGLRLDVALCLKLDETELVRRMTGRRECPVCKRAYNVVMTPSKDGIHCDDHPSTELRRRPDDTPETVRRRIGIYQEQTAPLVEYYRGRGQLKEISGAGPVDVVYAALRGALNGSAAGH